MPIHRRTLTVVVLECEDCNRKAQLNEREDPNDPPRGWTNVRGIVRCPKHSRRAGVAP